MIDPIALGVSDEGSRWIGVRRHQAVALIGGVLLVGDWLVRSHSNLVELIAGLVVASGAIPASGGLTLFELSMIALRYVLRSHWICAEVRSDEVGMLVNARGSSMTCGFELNHQGRLDLSGRGAVLTQSLVALVDALASSHTGRHLSIHVLNEELATRTGLFVSPGYGAPEGWLASDALVHRVVAGTGSSRSLRLERWTYLREQTGVLRVLRIDDFSGARSPANLLERLQYSPAWAELSLHVEIVERRRAPSVAGRAVHRSASDGAATSSVGFRRTAGSARLAQRLLDSERLVVSGRALLHIGVYIVVRASNPEGLNQLVELVRRNVVESGLRLQSGVGRQAVWFCHQLPGGPGW